MDEQLYREAILERFSNPINQGTLVEPDFRARLLNPLCGDEVEVAIKLDKEKKKVIQARFSGNGCAISQVAASLLVEYIEGKNLEETKKLDSEKLLGLLGIRPSPARMKCALLSLDALAAALAQT